MTNPDQPISGSDYDAHWREAYIRMADIQVGKLLYYKIANASKLYPNDPVDCRM